MYRSLQSSRIVATLEQLERRVAERFPNAGLSKVCAELTAIARETDERAHQLARPHYLLRTLSGLVLVCGATLFVYVATLVKFKQETGSVYEVLQGFDAGFNILIVMGIVVLFLVTLEGRWKRQQALADLDELRSVIHVIDMHQLTKDPVAGTGLETAGPTASSPKRSLSPFELVRYLDYCSEMLSLAAKIAAVYAQSSKDPQVVEASSDLQQITANLSAKIWQKINIAYRDARATPPPDVPPPQQPAVGAALPLVTAAAAPADVDSR